MSNDYALGATVRLDINFAEAAGGSLDPSTPGTIRVYKDDSTTQRTSSNGITYTTGYDGLTGPARVLIDTSDDSDAGFYAVGSDYSVMLVGAVVDGQTVNVWVGHFSIENRWNEVDVTKLNGIAAAAVVMQLMYSGQFKEGTVSDGTPAADGFDTDLTEADGIFDGKAIGFIDGPCAQQLKPIDTYVNASGHVAIKSSDPFTTAPANGNTFIILGRAT